MSVSEKPDDLLTIAQVCAEYQLSEETVRRWIREQRIPFVAVGPFRVKRISRSAIEKPMPMKEPIDPFDPQGPVATPAAGAPTVPTVAPKVITVARIKQRQVFLSCNHQFKQGDAMPMPKVGAVAFCPICSAKAEAPKP